MFQLLDDTLKKLLDSAPPNPITGLDDRFIDAEISFDTPEKGNLIELKTKNTINLFLYEVKENRELRRAAPNKMLSNGQSFSRRAPLRVDCTYMVTAWADKSSSGSVMYEHRLLGQAFNWLSRFPEIPEEYLQIGGLGGQIYAPPTMVAQMDGAKSAGEFWSALGIPPRPYFNLIVTITMDLDQFVEDSIVTTITSQYTQIGGQEQPEERIIIGGRVLNANNGPVENAAPVADAWVRVEETGEVQTTNELGQFKFTSLQRGKQYRLRVRAIGLGEAPIKQIDVPSPSGEYDIIFS